MTGALLSEVWPDMVQNPRKTKRIKKKSKRLWMNIMVAK